MYDIVKENNWKLRGILSLPLAAISNRPIAAAHVALRLPYIIGHGCYRQHNFVGKGCYLQHNLQHQVPMRSLLTFSPGTHRIAQTMRSITIYHPVVIPGTVQKEAVLLSPAQFKIPSGWWYCYSAHNSGGSLPGARSGSGCYSRHNSPARQHRRLLLPAAHFRPALGYRLCTQGGYSRHSSYRSSRPSSGRILLLLTAHFRLLLFGWDSPRALLSIRHAHQAVHGSEKHFLAQDCYSAHSLLPKGACNITVQRHFILLFAPLLSSAQFFVFLLLFAAHFCADGWPLSRTASSSALSASVLPRSSPHCTVFCAPSRSYPAKNFYFFSYCYSAHNSKNPGKLCCR